MSPIMRNQLKAILTIAILLLLFSAGESKAQHFTIKIFQSDIVIDEDGSFTVSEKIINTILSFYVKPVYFILDKTIPLYTFYLSTLIVIIYVYILVCLIFFVYKKFKN